MDKETHLITLKRLPNILHINDYTSYEYWMFTYR